VVSIMLLCRNDWGKGVPGVRGLIHLGGVLKDLLLGCFCIFINDMHFG